MLGSSVDFHKETKENRGRQGPGFRKWINSDFYNYISESGDRNKYLDLFCFYCFSALDRIHNNYRYKNKYPTFIHANIKPENIMTIILELILTLITLISITLRFSYLNLIMLLASTAKI